MTITAPPTAVDLDAHLAALATRGWTRIAAVFEHDLLDGILAEFAEHEHEFREIQTRKGIAEQTANATHHTFLRCPTMLELLRPSPLTEVVGAWFGGPFVLSTMGLSTVPPGEAVYTQGIHRDVRTNTGDQRLWVNTLVMFDDSTLDNGATWMLEGSQHEADRPDPERFRAEAVRATGRKGDVLVFDGNIWHAAGENRTDAPRRIVTPIFSRPYLKQQLDYPRALGEEFGDRTDAHLRQVLGYNARVPASLEEFYQPDELRYYRRDQG